MTIVMSFFVNKRLSNIFHEDDDQTNTKSRALYSIEQTNIVWVFVIFSFFIFQVFM